MRRVRRAIKGTSTRVKITKMREGFCEEQWSSSDTTLLSERFHLGLKRAALEQNGAKEYMDKAMDWMLSEHNTVCSCQ